MMTRGRTPLGLGLLALLGSVACGDLAGNAPLPPGTQSPDTYNTPAGALGVYRGAKADFQNVMASVVVKAGLLSDELTASGLGREQGNIGGVGDLTDERVLDENLTGRDDLYNGLHRIRGAAMQAISLLGTYAPALSPALRGEMYALQGYAEVLLAELYCSGVPLSTLDFQQDFTYKPRSTGTEVYQHALALFDSALTISSDSASVLALASVGKGRVLLNLGQYAQAGQAVATVPTAFRYSVPVVWKTGQQYHFFISQEGPASNRSNLRGPVVAASEGGNGLPFVTSNDLRVRVTPANPSTNPFGVSLFWPAKYPASSVARPVVLASGIEARLIEAEAALQANDVVTWAAILNALRASAGAFAIPAIGAIPDLPVDSTTEASPTLRVNVHFRERAFWLFLTGHRQGDLRRLVRTYGRPQETVYPTGAYFGGFGSYGSDVNLPIPESERINPLFHGCLDRGA